ncbi:MAG TPA: glycosyltransferase [Muribaculum sp.]|jgi:glycosyltransferase involved in cell wall biosynthesis|uniref:Glycosyltransferase n=1 Tax=Heminiphilus faecis TaxID=2601703 RepID=A0ABV4CXX1_9BACT|nr:glycosyltransferase [Heminiphilus faecis]RLT77733.1 glycosyltransferase [bacterium J10(2018)]HRF69133.1 glycosyltransferase [Muribaculum sp.]
MTLDVMIVTIGADGIKRVAAMNLPEVEEVRYIVSWQMPDGISAKIPDVLKRSDVMVCRHDDKGVSRNRNYAMMKSTADVCLVADDDLVYEPDMLRNVIAVFEDDDTLDVALFRYSGGSGKWYPSYVYDINRLQKGHFVSEVEIAFRRSTVAGTVRFNELLGTGSPVVCTGEGEMFLFTALKRGLRCRFFPTVIAVHQGISTGFRIADRPGVLMGPGVMIYMYHNRTWPLRIVVNAWRTARRSRGGFLQALQDMKNGALYARRFFNPDGTEKSL